VPAAASPPALFTLPQPALITIDNIATGANRLARTKNWNRR
jgi:hypothetical protein